MKAVATVGLGLFVVGVMAMAGCRHHRDEVEVVQEGPPPPPPPEVVVVQEAPPPPVVETYGPAPGPDYVWIGGYYTYVSRHYVWVRGYWGRPPHRGAIWVGHSWERERDGRYHYHPGHWR